jgi:hypothetical protein
MLNVNTLYVGDAQDGPIEEIVAVRSLDQIFRLFGGYHYERVVVTSGDTSYTLSVTPWANEVQPLQFDADGFLIPKRLFEFTVSGSVLSWTKLGESATVLFRATLEPKDHSLLKGALAAKRTNTAVHVLRLGGTHATAASGSFTFQSRYPGARYNGTVIQIAPGAVTVTPAAGTGRARSYAPATDRALEDALRQDVGFGDSGILLTGPLSRTGFTLPTITLTMTGGTNGALSVSGITQFLLEHDLSGVDVLCPIGLTTQALSGAGIPQLLATFDYPTLMVAQAPPSGAALSGAVNTLRNLCSVAFQTTYDAGSVKERLDDAAPLVAAIAGGTRYGITLAPLPEGPPVPRYDPSALHALASGGHTVAYRSISKDWALWLAQTGDPTWTLSTFRALQELARPVFDLLEPLLGNILIDEEAVDAQLGDAFRQVSSAQNIDWTLNLEGDVLYLDLSFTPYGEIRTVKAQIALGTPSSARPA